MKLTMNRNLTGILAIIAISLLLILAMVLFDDHGHEPGADAHGHGNDSHEEETEKGSHGGRLLRKDDFSLEITIYETGLPPEFRVYAYDDGEPVAVDKVQLDIALHRLPNITDNIGFAPQQDFLRGDGVIYEPHSFEVQITAQYEGETFSWHYDNFEGRTEITKAMADEMGIKTETVGPITLVETRTLTGRVQTDPNRLSRIKPRFAGIIQSIKHELGDAVKAGTTLAVIESNDSLQNYQVKAPIDGLIIKRDLQIGEATGDEPLFVIADLSQVWVELDVFVRDLGQIKTGQKATIETLEGMPLGASRIDYVSPLATHASQSVSARLILDNRDGQLRPGQYIRGQVTVAETPVQLAVKQSAIQSFRDFRVAFARFGDSYEVRMLELGKQNREWVEVLEGISPGTEYVTEHSYLIKADIEKSGASHDH